MPNVKCPTCGEVFTTGLDFNTHWIVTHHPEAAQRMDPNEQEEDMAELYGLIKGARAAGGVGHDEIHVQAQTWQGLIRITLNVDGSFKVVAANADGSGAHKIASGVIPSKTGGEFDYPASMMNTVEQHVDLSPLPMPSSAKSRTSTSPSKVTHNPTRKKAQARKKTAIPVPEETKQETAAATENLEKAVSQAVAAVAVSELSPGEKVTLVKCSPSQKAPLGSIGTVEKVRLKSPLGPMVTAVFDGHGPAVVYPDQGDTLARAQ